MGWPFVVVDISAYFGHSNGKSKKKLHVWKQTP